MEPYVGNFWRQGCDHQAASTMDVAIGCPLAGQGEKAVIT
jgi:hypothetical protein